MSPLHRLSSSRFHHSSAYTIAACVAAIATSQTYRLVESGNELNSEASLCSSATKCNASDNVATSHHEARHQNNGYNRHHAGRVRFGSSSQQRILASSLASNSSQQPSISGSTQKAKSQQCDYVVIGHGHAGQSAVKTLRTLDPTAEIMIIDPNNLHRPSDDGAKSARRNGGKVQHLPTRATFIQHSDKIVQVSPYNPQGPEAQTSSIHYRKSVLLATGSRGAPPPEECISVDSKSRILELRSTSVSPLYNSDNTAARTQHFPVLDPATVRNISLMAASQGATVAVMGSGFEALELAASLARASLQSNSNKHDEEDEKKVLLLFGNPGPLSTRIPRYLSAAISKRLRHCGIDVEDRSMTRYLSMHTPHHNSDQPSEDKSAIPRLEIYTVKSYDWLDSRRMVADLLVLAPSVSGLNGTAALPTYNHATTQKAGNNYQPWSSLVSPSLITCYLEDGRVMTNAEFLAASSIYAAGSAAKYPNVRTGQADVAGGDHMSADLSGEIAARNMVKEYLGGKRNQHKNEVSHHVQETITVWRSDQVSYVPSMSRDDGTRSITQPTSSLALYSMGIHALCVGKCDSTMATHGFWWTNTNSQLSDRKSTNRDNNSTWDSTGNMTRPNGFMRRITRKATNPVSRSSFSRGGSLPVYGSGVVFYLDKCGSIQGVMLWGLPFTKNTSDVQSEMNHLLTDRIKEIIRTNGSISIRDHSDSIAKESYGVSVDLDLLSYVHLSEESKFLAEIALTGNERDSSSFKPKIVLGKPLHRYTPWKPSEMTNLGKVRRKDVDDLFYSSSTAGDSSHHTNQWTKEQDRPPSLKRMYTMQGERIDSQPNEGQLLDERSRPPKEEPLWLRQHDEMRFTNRKEAESSAFIRNMRAGQFSDGSEAVKQAPVPQVFIDANEQLRLWATDSGDEESD
jgi:hypothetical protein